jgi:hypothetical protein
MNDESLLREHARNSIESGSVPGRSPDAVWGGPGAGAPCAVCAVIVTPEDVEMELEFSREDSSGADTYHFHSRCFAAWELERRSLDLARRPAASGPDALPPAPANRSSFAGARTP